MRARRDFLAATSAAAVAASFARPRLATADEDWDINAAFADFMADLGRSAGDGDDVVAEKPEGVIYVTVRGYSWDGPWKDVRTFDMEAVSTTGFTYVEGSGGEPSFGADFGDPAPLRSSPAFPPTLVMNDYIAGYLAGAGAIEALRRRASEGGSWHVHVNLARVAMWYASLGVFQSTDFVPGEENRMKAPDVVRFQSPYGEVERLAPMVKLSKTPGQWQVPLQTVRGSDKPVWKEDA